MMRAETVCTQRPFCQSMFNCYVLLQRTATGMDCQGGSRPDTHAD
jgi:hypothetical protein